MKNKISILLLVALVSIASSVTTSKVISQPAKCKTFIIRSFTDRYEAMDEAKRLNISGFVNINISAAKTDNSVLIFITGEKY